MKRCPGCGVTLPRSAFYPNHHRADGLRSECKPCGKARYQDWYREHLDEQRAAGRERGRRWKADHRAATR